MVEHFIVEFNGLLEIKLSIPRLLAQFKQTNNLATDLARNGEQIGKNYEVQ